MCNIASIDELENESKYIKFTPDQITKINPEEINNGNVIILTKTGSITCAKIKHIDDTHITLVSHFYIFSSL